MQVRQIIESRLSAALEPQFMEVLNESDQHNVPAGSESHFKVVLVSAAFEGKRSVQRHQQVYALLAEQLRGGVHALALHTYTPAEWQQRGGAPDSPDCMGGEKRER